MAKSDSLWDMDLDVEGTIRRMRQEFDRMFAWAREASREGPGPGGPYVWGYSLTVGSDGKPRLERFGNVPAGRQLEAALHEPFSSVQVDRERQRLTMTVDLPGVAKGDVHLKVEPERIHLRAEGRDREYEKTLVLDEHVIPDTAKAHLQDGILEVTLDLALTPAHPPREIPIE